MARNQYTQDRVNAQAFAIDRTRLCPMSTMQKVIPYYVRSIYGQDKLYLDTRAPDDALRAKHIQRLTGRVTITPQDMDALTGLGYELKQVLPPTR